MSWQIAVEVGEPRPGEIDHFNASGYHAGTPAKSSNSMPLAAVVVFDSMGFRPGLDKQFFMFQPPNAVWVSDITYIRTGQGWLYLAIVKDLCTKEIVGYARSARIDTNLILDALGMVIRRQSPPRGLIFHSDRGVQYASDRFRAAFLDAGFVQSVSRKGDPYDNAVAENFFRCLKCECLYLAHFFTHDQAADAVFAYIEAFYNNTVRPHSGCGWMAHASFEKLRFPRIPA